jgi:hypothetical protein
LSRRRFDIDEISMASRKTIQARNNLVRGWPQVAQVLARVVQDQFVAGKRPKNIVALDAESRPLLRVVRIEGWSGPELR